MSKKDYEKAATIAQSFQKRKPDLADAKTTETASPEENKTPRCTLGSPECHREHAGLSHDYFIDSYRAARRENEIA